MQVGDTKSNYFPVGVKDSYLMIGLIGDIHLSEKGNVEIGGYLGKEKRMELLMKAMKEKIDRPIDCFYKYLVDNEDYEAIHEYYEVSFGGSRNKTVTFVDLFSQQGSWLKHFKQAMDIREHSSSQIRLIANETNEKDIEVAEKNYVDEIYHEKKEICKKLPNGVSSVLLFNPPSNKMRLLLEEVVVENLVFKGKSEGHQNQNGVVLLVVNQNELIQNISYLIENFELDERLIYRVEEKEFKKNKQIVVFASLRNEPLINISQEIKKYTKLIEQASWFNEKLFNHTDLIVPDIPYEEIKNNHKIVSESIFEQSNIENDNWKWIREMTKLEDLSSEKIVKPTKPKVGEISNIIASGMINGDMELEKGKGTHIVAGGMKQQYKEEEEMQEQPNGEEKLVKKKMIYSVPYLNILISENGKAKIRELTGEVD